MKLPIVILILLLCFAGEQMMAQRVKTLEHKNFEAPKEEVVGTVTHRSAKDSTKVKKEKPLKLTKKEFKEFDSKGRMIKFDEYLTNPIGKLIKMTQKVRAWEKDSRSEEVSKYDEMGDLVSKVKTHYTLKNKKIKVESEDPLGNPGQKNTKAYEYGSNGKVSKVVMTNKDGKKIGEESWKYNGDDKEILYKRWETKGKAKLQEQKKTTYNKDGSLGKSEKTLKDFKGDSYKEVITFERNRMKEQLKYKNGEVVSEFGGGKGKYDPSKAKVLVDFGNGGGGGFGMWTNEDEFDDDGNKIKTTQTVDDVVTQITHYEYDNRDNLTKTKKVSYEDEKESSVEEEIIEYDKFNNMLRKAVYNNGTLISENTYDYTYH
ncbi:MAG: hypothetical protein GY810_12935 [Aureispira sp.]|nr:hypothetical protein [Aureispira sp.]